jgi:hypothetical protein
MIFGEDGNSYSLHATPLKTEAELNNGLWLVVAGINDIPPHIAILSEGKYYSLSVRKVDSGSSLSRFINTLRRKHIPALFIQLSTKNDASLCLEKTYTDLPLLSNTENTCLSPIKKFFAEYYYPDFASANYVFELLAMAEKKKLIIKCISLFCENTNSNMITLPKYTMLQIRNKIDTLSAPITPLK